MTVENFDQVLERLVSRKPFQFFTIELHDGRSFEVDHPAAMAFRFGVAAFVARGGRPFSFDRNSIRKIDGVPVSND